MYDEWGNDVASGQDFYQVERDFSFFSEVETTPPLIVEFHNEEPQVVPFAENSPPLELFEDPFVLPGTEEHPATGPKRGSDDWLTPLFNEGDVVDLDDLVVTANPRTPGQVYNDGDYGGWDGHDTSQTEVPPPPVDDCGAAERRIQLTAEYYREIERANNHIQTVRDLEYQRDLLLASTPGNDSHNEPGEFGFDLYIAGLNALIIWNTNEANNAFLRAQEIDTEIRTLRCR